MKFIKIALFFTFIYCVLLIYPGIYYEEMSDVLFSIMHRGYFTSEPVPLFNNYGSHFLLTHLYIYLENKISIGWYGILNIFFMYLATINLAYCIYILTKEKNKSIQYSLYFILIILLTHDILFLQYTKTAIYLVFSSVFVLSYRLKNNKLKPSTFLILYNILLLIIGIMLRQYSILLVIVLYLPILLFQLKQNENLNKKQLVIYFTVFSIITILLLRLSLLSYNSTDRSYAEFAEYKISIFDNKQSASTLHLKNEIDSINYDCLKNYFIPELTTISADYLESLGIYKSHSITGLIKLSVFDLSNKINMALLKWASVFSNKKHWIFILLTFAFFITITIKNYKSLFRSVLYIIWFIFSLLFISIIVKTEERVIFPTIVILTIVCAENLSYIPNRNSIFQLMLFSFLIISSYFYIQTIYWQIKIRKEQEVKTDFFISQFINKNTNKVFVLNHLSKIILENKVLNFNNEVSKIKWFCMPPEYLIFYPEYYQKQYNITGTNNFKEFIEYSVLHKDKIFFIYTEDRIELLKKYCLIIHGISLKFKIQQSNIFESKLMFNSYPCNVYTIE